MPQINLAPTGADKQKNRNKILNLGLLLASGILVAGVAGYYLYLSLGQRDKSLEIVRLEKRKDELSEDIKQSDSGGIKEFQEKTADLGALLQNHIYFSKILEDMEKNTLMNVRHSSLDVSISENTVKLSSETSDLESIARQLAVFSADENIEKVALSSDVGEDSNIKDSKSRFNLEIIYKQDFAKNSKPKEK